MEKPSRLESLVQVLKAPKRSERQLEEGYVCSPQFEKFLYFMSQLEEQRVKSLKEELEQNYMFWASCYELLKSEFNQLWNFFTTIEEQTAGWYCVSPSLAKWSAVGHGSGGYTFSACIMKNHDREAPQAEKSLTVSFAFESLGHGIGDERGLGRTTGVDDTLVGLENCQGVDLGQQIDEAKRLVDLCKNTKLIFRLNHRKHGQESTRLDINVLKEHSMVSLAEKLFMALNNDVLMKFERMLAPKEQRLYIE